MARRQFHQRPEPRLTCPACGKRGLAQPVVTMFGAYRQCRYCKERHPLNVTGRLK